MANVIAIPMSIGALLPLFVSKKLESFFANEEEETDLHYRPSSVGPSVCPLTMTFCHFRFQHVAHRTRREADILGQCARSPCPRLIPN